MARLVTAASIMQQARMRVDRVGAQNPPDSELLAMLNQSFPRWYDLLVEAYGSDYAWNSYQFTSSANVNDYALPADFHTLRFIDSQLTSGATPTWVNVKRYDEALRNAYQFVNGGGIPAGQIFRLSYNPTCPVLAQYASLNLLASNGIDSVLLTAVQPGLPGTNVSVVCTNAGSESISVNGYTITIQSGPASTCATITSSINTNASAQQLVSASQTALPSAFALVQGATPLGGTLQFDFINGWERYLIADLSAIIATRLGYDPSVFLQERSDLEEKVRALAEDRDAGSPQVVKDTMMEQLTSGSLYAGWTPYRYGYRIQGSNLHLIRLATAGL